MDTVETEDFLALRFVDGHVRQGLSSIAAIAPPSLGDKVAIDVFVCAEMVLLLGVDYVYGVVSRCWKDVCLACKICVQIAAIHRNRSVVFCVGSSDGLGERQRSNTNVSIN